MLAFMKCIFIDTVLSSLLFFFRHKFVSNSSVLFLFLSFSSLDNSLYLFHACLAIVFYYFRNIIFDDNEFVLAFTIVFLFLIIFFSFFYCYYSSFIQKYIFYIDPLFSFKSQQITII